MLVSFHMVSFIIAHSSFYLDFIYESSLVLNHCWYHVYIWYLIWFSLISLSWIYYFENSFGIFIWISEFHFGITHVFFWHLVWALWSVHLMCTLSYLYGELCMLISKSNISTCLSLERNDSLQMQVFYEFQLSNNLRREFYTCYAYC